MFITSRNKKEKGQGLVEYALILVLVAIVVIAALMILGPIIGNVFSKGNSSLSTVSTGGTGGGTNSDTKSWNLLFEMDRISMGALV